jgi:hypothetical protein
VFEPARTVTEATEKLVSRVDVYDEDPKLKSMMAVPLLAGPPGVQSPPELHVPLGTFQEDWPFTTDVPATRAKAETETRKVDRNVMSGSLLQSVGNHKGILLIDSSDRTGRRRGATPGTFTTLIIS